MERVSFEVVPQGKGWVIAENTAPGPTIYTTREAAFEAIVGAASNAIKQGQEISILIRAVPGRTL